MSKHYIRIDEENKVIYGYSDDFEEVVEGDICINENGGRQFELLGEINPNILDANGCHRFRYDSITEEHEEEVTEDVTDEVEVIVDTSKVKLDDPDAKLDVVDIDKGIKATAKGTKIVTTTTYFVRYSTDEELADELASIPVQEPTKTAEEKIKELQEQVDMLTDCLLEMSEIVYGE